LACTRYRFQAHFIFILGATDIQLRSPPGTPLIQIHLNQEKLKFWGIQAQQIIQTIQAYKGQVVGKHLQAEWLQSPDLIGQLPIRTLSGTDKVASIKITAVIPPTSEKGMLAKVIAT
jgi:Cu/Ag efflux pump CusA